MRYGELVQLYFDRSSALQWYWTIYVVIIGGLLAFSSLRKQKDIVTGILVTVLYLCFAYKNMGAIGDVTAERHAILTGMKLVGGSAAPAVGATAPTVSAPAAAETADVPRVRAVLEPTLNPPPFAGLRNFHIACDLLTVAALWAMEWRRHRLPMVKVES